MTKLTKEKQQIIVCNKNSCTGKAEGKFTRNNFPTEFSSYFRLFLICCLVIFKDSHTHTPPPSAGNFSFKIIIAGKTSKKNLAKLRKKRKTSSFLLLRVFLIVQTQSQTSESGFSFAFSRGKSQWTNFLFLFAVFFSFQFSIFIFQDLF